MKREGERRRERFFFQQVRYMRLEARTYRLLAINGAFADLKCIDFIIHYINITLNHVIWLYFSKLFQCT